MIYVGIIEEDNDRRQELADYINSQPELVCTVVVGSLEALLAQRASYPAMVILMHCSRQDPVAQQIKQLKQQLPGCDIMVISDQDDTAVVLDALRAGALGYLAPEVPLWQIKESILGISVGGAYMSPAATRRVTDFFRQDAGITLELTAREKEIVACLTEGMSYKMIACKLFLSLDTVRFHLRNIYKKLQVNSKAQVIAKVLNKDFLLTFW